MAIRIAMRHIQPAGYFPRGAGGLDVLRGECRSGYRRATAPGQGYPGTGHDFLEAAEQAPSAHRRLHQQETPEELVEPDYRKRSRPAGRSRETKECSRG